MSKINNNNLMVTQANQVALASYSLTLEEKRIILFLTSLIQQEDQDFKEYRIPITELQKYLKLKRKDFYKSVKHVIDELMGRVVTIEKPDGGWIKINWISFAEYKPKGEDGLEFACLDLAFDPKMKPYLLQLKSQFFSYMLANVANLKSIYSIRFYEIFASYRRLGKVSFDVDDIKNRLQILNKYKQFKDFRVRVIIPAQKELKEKTDIYFEFEEERKGRKVAKIHFTIFSQTTSDKLEEKNVEDKNIKQKEIKSVETEKNQTYTQAQQEADQALKRNGVDQKGRESLINDYDPDQILENSNLVLERYKEEKLKDLAGSTVTAVKTDWRVKKSPYEKEKEEKKQAVIKIREEQENQKKRLEVLEKDFEVQKKEKTRKAYDAINDDRKKEFILEFEKTLNKMVLNLYKNGGIESPGVKVLFNGFVAKKLLKPEEYDFIKWAKSEKGCTIEKDRYDTYQLV